MKKLIIALLICSLYLSTPIQSNAYITSTVGLIRISADSITLNNGVLVSGEISSLDDADETGITYRETKATFAGTPIAMAFETEDDANKWYISDNFGSVDNTTTNPYEGSYCIEAEANATGTAKLIFDNNTSNAWNFDATHANKMNFTMKGEIAKYILSEIRTYTTVTKYSWVQPNIALTTSWEVLSISPADMTFAGGVQIGDPVNWVEFTFTVQTGGSGKSIFFDSGGFYGPAVDDIIRQLDGVVTFSNIPNGYDHYILNVSAKHLKNTTYGDSFFSENAADWTDASLIISNDTENACAGSTAIKIEYDASSNMTIIFDNGTSQNMQADFDDYDAYFLTTWGNSTFTIDGAKWYTDSNNYYYIDVDQEYSTTATTMEVPIALHSTYGNPTRSNISWMEFAINNISNPNSLTIWLDCFYLGTTETIRFQSDINGITTMDTQHVCDECEPSPWVSAAIVLDNTKLIEDGYICTLEFNDTLPSGDNFNTSIIIDYCFITAWNDAGAGGGGGVADDDTTDLPVSTTEIDKTRTVTIYQPPWLLFGGLFIVLLIALYWSSAR